MVRIEVDHGLCVGNAMCVATAPGVFAHNEHRQSTVVAAGGEPAALVVEAAANCPVSAIRVVDGDTGGSLFPPDPAAGSYPAEEHGYGSTGEGG